MLLASPVKQELSNLTYDSMAEHIPSAVKQAQSVLPGTSVSDLTNGFTDAFCADVTNRPGLTELQKRYLIDQIAQSLNKLFARIPKHLVLAVNTNKWLSA
jgi:hypothetical protein